MLILATNGTNLSWTVTATRRWSAVLQWGKCGAIQVFPECLVHIPSSSAVNHASGDIRMKHIHNAGSRSAITGTSALNCCESSFADWSARVMSGNEIISRVSLVHACDQARGSHSAWSTGDWGGLCVLVALRSYYARMCCFVSVSVVRFWFPIPFPFPSFPWIQLALLYWELSSSYVDKAAFEAVCWITHWPYWGQWSPVGLL